MSGAGLLAVRVGAGCGAGWEADSGYHRFTSNSQKPIDNLPTGQYCTPSDSPLSPPTTASHPPVDRDVDLHSACGWMSGPGSCRFPGPLVDYRCQVQPMRPNAQRSAVQNATRQWPGARLRQKAETRFGLSSHVGWRTAR